MMWRKKSKIASVTSRSILTGMPLVHNYIHMSTDIQLFFVSQFTKNNWMFSIIPLLSTFYFSSHFLPAFVSIIVRISLSFMASTTSCIKVIFPKSFLAE